MICLRAAAKILELSVSIGVALLLEGAPKC
jgi:hypothetical protein